MFGSDATSTTRHFTKAEAKPDFSETVDGQLEDRGYVERRPNPDDRRQYALYLTAAGKEVMGKLSRLARQHDRAITGGLSDSQRAQLSELFS